MSDGTRTRDRLDHNHELYLLSPSGSGRWGSENPGTATVGLHCTGVKIFLADPVPEPPTEGAVWPSETDGANR